MAELGITRRLTRVREDVFMKKRTAGLLGIFLAAALMTAGCGSDSGQDTTKDTEQKTEAKDSAESKDTAKEDVSAADEKADDTDKADTEEPVTILMAAAASLEYSMKDELIPMFQEQHPNITVEGTYDSSGKLQTQIESGIDADLFFSAAEKQMTALKDENLIDGDSIQNLLENKIVLVVPSDKKDAYTKFEDVVNAETIAVGDPESVPVGQYSQEALTSLGLWDQVSAKASLGTNVTEVLNWVSEGSADAGIVYATDAATKKDSLAVVAEAPEGSLAQKVLYPAGIVSSSTKKDAAQLFLDFLASDQASKVFDEYGFTPVK